MWNTSKVVFEDHYFKNRILKYIWIKPALSPHIYAKGQNIYGVRKKPSRKKPVRVRVRLGLGSGLGSERFFPRTDNLGQKVGDKFTKLSKTGFPMECFTLIFCNFLQKTVKIWLLGGRLGTCHQIQTFQGFSWNFLFP